METRGAAMGFTAAAGGFVAFLLSMSAVQGQNTLEVDYSADICASRGSTVSMTCSGTTPTNVPGTKTFWFTTEVNNDPFDLTDDSDYKDRATNICWSPTVCTLTIKDLKESDSKTYRCRFSDKWTGEPGTTLTVTALQINVIRVTVYISHTEVELTCSSSCGGPSYVWFINGQEVQGKRGTSYTGNLKPGDGVSCGLCGFDDRRSPSLYAPKRLSVSVRPSKEVMEGSSVTLTCSSDANPAANYTWYKKNENLKPLREEPHLVFSSIQSSDSGQFYCKAENKLGRTRSDFITIDVKYAPKFASVSVSPSAEIMEGSSVTLTCSSDANPAANYTWYKEDDKHPRLLIEEPQYVFSSIKSSDSGEYYCTADNQLGTENTSKHKSIDVKYAPKLPSVSVSPSAEIVEGSSVNLTCSSDANPAANSTWYKLGELHPLGEGDIYRFTSISTEDKGIYFCTSKNQHGWSISPYLPFDVQYAPKFAFVSESSSAEVVEGSSVTLTCNSDANPAASYTWYKEYQPLLQGSERVYRFTSISSEDSGTYFCKSENKHGKTKSPLLQLNVQNDPKLPSVSVSPSGEVMEGSSVTLTCSRDANIVANYTWYKEDGKEPLSEEPQLVFSSIQSSDSGQYYCEAENQLGRRRSNSISIDVKYAPRLPSVSVSPSAEIVEGSSVNLTCSSDANPAANYTWYKENENLKPLSEEPHLVFSSIQSSDYGEFYCEAENQLGTNRSELVSVDVKYGPRLPSVSVSPSAKVVEGSSVTLTCSSDANPAANYTWWKEDEDSPKASGQIFTITDFRAEHSGSYSCAAQNTRGSSSSAVHVTVAASFPAGWTVAAASFTVISIFFMLIFVFQWVRNKRALQQAPEPIQIPCELTQKQPAEEENGCHYASIQFSKKQAESLYANIPPPLDRRQKQEEDVDRVEYATVIFRSRNELPGNITLGAGEDPAAFYSTVNKTNEQH